MQVSLAHRGPDGRGLLWRQLGVLGHTRLAILDLSGGAQPMQAGEHAISYNGEVYNHLELRRRHLSGARLKTHSDTETILQLYRKFGPRCLKLFNGMFAIAILGPDGLFLARDPLGIKPLYLGRRGETLYFASEIKALNGLVDEIGEFPAGHWYHTRQGLHRYYRVGEWPQRPSAHAPHRPEEMNEAEVRALIAQTLRQAVHLRLLSDAPLGVSLSGGLDSSLVAALAREGLERLDTFAVGVEGSQDLLFARRVARLLGTRHHEWVYTQEEMLAALPEIIFSLESFDPALVRSAIPNYFLARLASERVKVFLTGEGADELYAGYDYLARFREADELHRELNDITAALHNTNLQRADRISMLHGLEARVPFLDIQSVALAFSLPAAWKLQGEGRPSKWLLRKSFAGVLPEEILHRPKQKFSAGAGSSQLLASLAEDSISSAEFVKERRRLLAEWGYRLPNKEGLYYYRILRRNFSDAVIFPNMGHSRSL